MLRRSACRWASRFFGLGPQDKELLVLEPAFLLMYYCGFTFNDVLHLPVPYKRWFIERVTKEINKSAENGGSAESRAYHQNTPDIQQLKGKFRNHTPSRLRRFT